MNSQDGKPTTNESFLINIARHAPGAKPMLKKHLDIAQQHLQTKECILPSRLEDLL